jgi:hypothetical protein
MAAEEKAFNKIPHRFMTKALKKLGKEERYPNITQAVYDRPTAKIVFKKGKTKSISPKIRNKTKMTTLSTLIQNRT